MSRYKPYPQYKNSGVEWLGEVPEHWEVKRLKFVASYKNSNIDKKSYENQKQVRLCNYTDVYYNEKITNDIEFMIATASDSEINAMSLKKGDIIITKDSENPADIGIPAIVIEELDNTVCGYHLTVIEANYDMDSFYLYRTIQSSNTKAYLHAETPGITRYGLKQDTIGSILVVYPPYSEQQQIASYLDNATCKIDTLIQKQQNLIELLKEKRQALISHTVTKGLNPHVKMKDSGVEWLGEVPEHWEVVQSRRLFKDRKEKARNDDEQLTASQKYGVIYQKEFMELEGRKVTLVLTGSEILKHVEAGDFVISMRSFQGGLELCKYSGSVSSAYIGLIPIKHVIHDYFKYLFKSITYIQALQSTSNLVRDGQALRFENFSQVDLVIVPEIEQQQIANYLDNATCKIDTLISKAQEAIELLKERRTALISATVTGKIDVREITE